jgi:hypothetical protein
MNNRRSAKRAAAFSIWSFLAALFLLPAPGAGQNHDFIWHYGHSYLGPGGVDNGQAFFFGRRPPESRAYRRTTYLYRYAHTMTDSAGDRVLYHSDGLALFNRLGGVMENGDTLNPGWEQWFAEGILLLSGYPSPLSGLSIPYPGRPGEYLYFHQRAAQLPEEQGGRFAARDIYYTHIDMTANDGLGRVVSKNNQLFGHFSTAIGLTKMGSGEGWWLAHGAYASNVYRVYAIDSLGVSLHRIDTLGQDLYAGGQQADWPGLGGFSPDGAKFARTDSRRGIVLLDFDRCAGEWSNARFYPVPSGESVVSLAFSPNSRFIYYNTPRAVMQLDTWAAPGDNPLDTIGYLDQPFEAEGEANSFTYSELAPDGKIYIAPLASPFYHVIERPDLLGQACGFRQRRGPLLPEINFSSIPHFPNYRLEAVNCD